VSPASFPTVFDSTMLNSAASCHHRFFREHCENWHPKGQSVHLHAGGAFAHGLEAARKAFYVEGRSREDAEAIGIAALLTFYGDFDCPPDSAKSAERMAGALEFYFASYPLGADGTPPVTLASGKKGIELSFVEPLPIAHPETGEPLLYSGRLDMLVEYAGGIFIEDDKTTSSLGATWSRQWDLRSQFTGYCWGLRQCANIHAAGVLIRGVSILKTKYDTQQAITYRSDWQIAEWFERSLDLIEDLIRSWKRGYWRKALDSACNEYGGCGLRSACLSRDPLPHYETHFEQKRWDPILRVEVPL